MTEDRALKRAIRQRMEETGEKYTEARRALVGAAPAFVHPSASEPFWEEKRKMYDEIAAREGEVVAQARMFDLLHVLQLMFALPPAPPNVIGEPTAPGGWPLPMRKGVECNAAAVEASTPLAEAGFGRQIERNREIVERALALIDGTAGRPKQAREGRARVRPDGPPTARPRLRTCRTLPAGGPDGWGRSSELDHEPSHSSRDHALRHPFAGNQIRAAAEGMGDPTVIDLIDAWLDDLQRNYRELVEGIPATWREHGQLDFEAVIEELDDDDDPDPGMSWVRLF